MILNRDHHRFAAQVNAENLVISENLERIYDKIERKFTEEYNDEIKDGIILFDRSMKKPYKFDKADFRVFDDGEINHIFKESELIRKLKKIDLFRIYVARDKEGMGKEMKKLLKKTIREYEKRG